MRDQRSTVDGKGKIYYIGLSMMTGVINRLRFEHVISRTFNTTYFTAIKVKSVRMETVITGRHVDIEQIGVHYAWC